MEYACVLTGSVVSEMILVRNAVEDTTHNSCVDTPNDVLNIVPLRFVKPTTFSQ